MESDALWAFLTAAVASALLTPLAARLAMRVGAVDEPRERGLADRPTPLFGGLAMLAGILIAAALFMPSNEQTRGILAGAAVIVAIGAVDDVFDLHPAVKLLGQAAAAAIPVAAGVKVDNITLPFVGAIDFGDAGGVLTLIGLVGVMNVVNLSDGVDGLAAGVCTISAATFAIIAFDLQRDAAGVLAALTAGAALGFLIHNFHPASIFMGDSGSNLLGLMLGCIAVQGSLKTNALIALVGPLVILAVPFLDTGFVVAKRLKYRRKPWEADAEHFHHRLARIGFSQRRTVLYLYGWTIALAGLALALRFVPYSDDSGHLHVGWTLVMVALGLLALAASVYLVYVLEIFKFRRAARASAARSGPGHRRARDRGDRRARGRDRRVPGARSAAALVAVERRRPDVDEGGEELVVGRVAALDDSLVAGALGHPGEGEGRRLGGDAGHASGRLLLLDAPSRRVDEAPDQRAPELGDDLVVGRRLDDRAQQDAVLAIEADDALQSALQRRAPVALAAPPHLGLGVEALGHVLGQAHEQLALVAEVEVEGGARDAGAAGDVLDRQVGVAAPADEQGLGRLEHGRLHGGALLGLGLGAAGQAGHRRRRLYSDLTLCQTWC